MINERAPDSELEEEEESQDVEIQGRWLSAPQASKKNAFSFSVTEGSCGPQGSGGVREGGNGVGWAGLGRSRGGRSHLRWNRMCGSPHGVGFTRIKMQCLHLGSRTLNPGHG